MRQAQLSTHARHNTSKHSTCRFRLWPADLLKISLFSPHTRSHAIRSARLCSQLNPQRKLLFSLVLRHPQLFSRSFASSLFSQIFSKRALGYRLFHRCGGRSSLPGSVATDTTAWRNAHKRTHPHNSLFSRDSGDGTSHTSKCGRNQIDVNERTTAATTAAGTALREREKRHTPAKRKPPPIFRFFPTISTTSVRDSSTNLTGGTLPADCFTKIDFSLGIHLGKFAKIRNALSNQSHGDAVQREMTSALFRRLKQATTSPLNG